MRRLIRELMTDRQLLMALALVLLGTLALCAVVAFADVPSPTAPSAPPAAPEDKYCLPFDTSLMRDHRAIVASGFGLPRDDMTFAYGSFAVLYGPPNQVVMLTLVNDRAVGVILVAGGPPQVWRDDGFVNAQGQVRTQPGRPCQWVQSSE